MKDLTLNQPTAGADAVIQPEPAASSLPVAASAAAAEYFDLGDCVTAIGEDDLRTNRDKTLVATPAADPVVRPSFHSIAPALAPVPRPVRETDAAWREAELLAGLCRQFEQLLATGGHSLRTAAGLCGKSPAFFSGENSMYSRYQRHGVAGLLPAVRVVPATTMPVPDWFVPAAQFFYLKSNHGKHAGSVPEAVRRTISLPQVPFGWPQALIAQLLRAIGLDEIPACPPDLRAQILARQAAGRPLVPPALASRIMVNASTVQFARAPRDWSLANQSAPGSQRRHTVAGERQAMAPGDWFGGDDATPGIAICCAVSEHEVQTVTTAKYGVLLGRFQWLAYHDARADKILAWSYVIRPRGSYRAEDILVGMSGVVRTHGIPRCGWQFEGGTFASKLVKQAIALMGCQHWQTYSPHQKAIESIFNRVWTRLAVQFPHADMGRYTGENEANCLLYEACKKGQKDPRTYFPTLEIVLRVFAEEVSAHNSKLIVSEQYGRWVPDEYFAVTLAKQPLRAFSEEMLWMFAPYSVERTVQGMLVRCRVPMFEDFSVPFEFGADWLPQVSGKKVRLHFDPRQPQCLAKVVLLENAGQQTAGTILGDAQLIGETAGYIRYIQQWGDDNQRAGYLARQKAARFVRRETRGVGAAGRVEYAKSEQHGALGTSATVEKFQRAAGPQEFGGSSTAGNGDPVRSAGASNATFTPRAHLNSRSARLESPSADEGAVDPVTDRATRRAELARLQEETAHLFET